MIEILNARNFKEENYDEAWLTVRAVKHPVAGTKYVPTLSPTWELFRRYRELLDNDQWNAQSFAEVYVPEFISEMYIYRRETFPLLSELWKKDKEGKCIALICYCADEALCHRSILAGLLQGAGCSVKTEHGTDYSIYYKMLMELQGK